jgi:hypothetical protein
MYFAPTEKAKPLNRYWQITANLLDRGFTRAAEPLRERPDQRIRRFPYSALGLCKGPFGSIPEGRPGGVFFISAPDKAVRGADRHC